MTASPIDAKGSITDAERSALLSRLAREYYSLPYRKLETLLDSKIATTTNLTALLRAVRRPKEEFWTYPKLDKPFETALCKLLKENFGDLKVLEPVFRFAWKASTELGPWCADHVWTHALAEKVIPRLEAKINRISGSEAETPENTERDIQRIRGAAKIVKDYILKSPKEPGQLSPKVELLLRQLTQQFSRSVDKKCIVFTRRRSTAKALTRLCEIWNIPNVRPGMLVGVRREDITGSVTFRDQFLVLIKFRQGEINCLVRKTLENEKHNTNPTSLQLPSPRKVSIFPIAILSSGEIRIISSIFYIC